MGSRRPEPCPQTQSPSTQPYLALTKVARWALTVEPARLQGLARGPSEAGVRQTGVVPTLAHSGASSRRLRPAAQLQPLIVDVQQADTAPETDADRGPL